MRKSIFISAIVAALLAGAMIFISMPTRDAAAQTSQDYVIIVDDLNVKPADTAKFLEAAKEIAAASVKDPGCREFNIVVSKTDPNNIIYFVVYDNQAGLDAHRLTDHYKKYQATTANMVASRNIKTMSSIAMNSGGH